MIANTLITQLNNPAELLKINQRLATIVSVILLIACAYLLAEITWMLFSQEDDGIESVQGESRVVSNRQVRQNNFRQLTSANLFGLGQQSATTQQAKAPVTRLNLTLKGVLAAVPMELASAIIAQGKSGKEDIYSVGDKMSGGVSIKEIHPEHVVLERNGRSEILKLQKHSGVNGQRSNRLKSAPTSRLNGGSGQKLTNIRSEILNNPSSFSKYAVPFVVKENGKQVGYRLKPQGKGQVLSELGLQASDVITEINGVKLDNPKNGFSALRKLKTAKNLNIVVKRNGAEVPLNLTLQ